MGGQIILDDVMSKQEQKEMGISRLTYQQKLKLEAWLNEHCMMKPTPSEGTCEAPKEETQELTVSLNIQGGRRLQLSDGSLWEIAPNDIPNASFWVLPIPVKIAPSNDVKFPNLLINQQTGISVRARQIQPSSSANPAS